MNQVERKSIKRLNLWLFGCIVICAAVGLGWAATVPSFAIKIVAVVLAVVGIVCLCLFMVLHGKALDGSMGWYKHVLAASPLPTAVTDSNKVFTYVNQAFIAQMHTSEERLLGQTWNEKDFLKKAGNMQAVTVQLSDDSGQLMGYVVTLKELSAQSGSLSQETEKAAALEQAVMEKSQALAEANESLVQAKAQIAELKAKAFWYVNILDSIPFPISVTDNNMMWTFINKPVEMLLQKTRAELMGKHCSNWGANICGTENCGIYCLKNNVFQTTFEQMGLRFEVDTAFLHDEAGNVCGHIEVVQDITKLSNLNKMLELLNQINGISTGLAQGAEQVSNGAESVAKGATEQAGAIEQLSSAIETILAQVKENASSCQKAGELSESAMSAVEVSNEQMQKLMVSMKEINRQSNEINKIIKTIEDIAFQTNILALNAAVEAARAGNAGKGFAVVAEEVRSLAARSAEAAKSTTSLIESSVASIADGVKIADVTAKDLNELVVDTKATASIISEISQSSREQAQAIGQLTVGIEQISSVVLTNSATSEESAAASKELLNQADTLKNLVSTFQLESA